MPIRFKLPALILLVAIDRRPSSLTLRVRAGVRRLKRGQRSSIGARSRQWSVKKVEPGQGMMIVSMPQER